MNTKLVSHSRTIPLRYIVVHRGNLYTYYNDTVFAKSSTYILTLSLTRQKQGDQADATVHPIENESPTKTGTYSTVYSQNKYLVSGRGSVLRHLLLNV